MARSGSHDEVSEPDGPRRTPVRSPWSDPAPQVVPETVPPPVLEEPPPVPEELPPPAPEELPPPRAEGSYRELMDRLSALPAALAAEQARIALWYDRQVDTAKTAEARATEAVRDAEEHLRAARATAEWTEVESGRLWRVLERRVGRVGPPPPPAPQASPEDDPLKLLRSASGMLTPPSEREGRRRWLAPVVALLGVVLIVALAGLGLMLSGR